MLDVRNLPDPPIRLETLPPPGFPRADLHFSAGENHGVASRFAYAGAPFPAQAAAV